MKTQLFSIVIASLLLLFACGGGNNNGKGNDNGGKADSVEAKPSQSIIVLLDLSDRVEKRGQADKDQQIIRAVLEEFDRAQLRFGYVNSKDKLLLAVAPQPNVEAYTNDDLLIDMGRQGRPSGTEQPMMGKPYLQKRRQAFDKAIAELYAQAARTPFTGADIYTFFCSELAAKYLRQDMPNKVVVITDGYLLFDRKFLANRPKCSYMRYLPELRAAQADWQAYFERKKLELCPCSRPLDKVEVLLLETAPRGKGTSVYEFDIVEHYWQNWFDAMGVPATIYPEEDKIEVIRDKVRFFLKQ